MGWTSSPLCTRTTSDAQNSSPAFPSILPVPHKRCKNGTKTTMPTTSSVLYGWVHPPLAQCRIYSNEVNPSAKTPWTIMLHEFSHCYWGNPTFENVLLWALKRLGQEEPAWLWELLESSHHFMISTHYQPVCTSLTHVVWKRCTSGCLLYLWSRWP